MKSPVDPTVEMVTIKKFGVEFEYCPTTGGVWLDKGELEKIIKEVKKQMSQAQNNAPQIDDSFEAPEKRNYNDDDYGHYESTSERRDSRERTRNNERPRKKRRESFLEEIFDFDMF